MSTPATTPPAAGQNQKETDPFTTNASIGAGQAGQSAPPPVTVPPTAADSIATVKSDLHQVAEDARSAYWSISATARADFQRLLSDVEAAEGASLASLKKLLGI